MPKKIEYTHIECTPKIGRRYFPTLALSKSGYMGRD